jgi:hypothetical protein
MAAPRALKLIKNGVETFAPYNASIMKLYNERNLLIKKSKNRDKEHVVIVEATPEEAALHFGSQQAAPQRSTGSQRVAFAAPAAENSGEVEKLKKENKSLEQRLAKLEALLSKEDEEEGDAEEFQTFDDSEGDQPEDEKPKKKPGRPAKK